MIAFEHTLITKKKVFCVCSSSKRFILYMKEKKTYFFIPFSRNKNKNSPLHFLFCFKKLVRQLFLLCFNCKTRFEWWIVRMTAIYICIFFLFFGNRTPNLQVFPDWGSRWREMKKSCIFFFFSADTFLKNEIKNCIKVAQSHQRLCFNQKK